MHSLLLRSRFFSLLAKREKMAAYLPIYKYFCSTIAMLSNSEFLQCLSALIYFQWDYSSFLSVDLRLGISALWGLAHIVCRRPASWSNSTGPEPQSQSVNGCILPSRVLLFLTLKILFIFQDDSPWPHLPTDVPYIEFFILPPWIPQTHKSFFINSSYEFCFCVLHFLLFSQLDIFLHW